MSRPNTLDTALERGDKIALTLGQLLNRHPHTGGKRIGLVLAYLSMVAEHHLSILLLVRENYFGSAMALVRPLMESLIRMLWIARCATEAQVKEISTSKDFEFRGTGMLAEEIDGVYRTDGFFANLKRYTWKQLCDFTHTGSRQISGRFKGKTIQPNYAPQTLLTAANMVNAGMLLGGAGFFELMEYEEEVAVVNTMMHDYDLTGGSVQ